MTDLTPEQIAALMASNPALARQMTALVSRHQEPDPGAPVRGRSTPVPMPQVSELSALQITTFDNMIGGKKPKYKSRYTVTLEAWTVEAKAINIAKPQVKMSTELYEYWAFGDKCKNLHLNGSISDAYYEELLKVWKDLHTNDMDEAQPFFGLLRSKSGGTNYFDRQFVIVFMTPKTFEAVGAVLLINGEQCGCENFVTTTCRDKPLVDAAQFQARMDFCDFSVSWATTKVPNS
jgi:hypothetical protein